MITPTSEMNISSKLAQVVEENKNQIKVSNEKLKDIVDSVPKEKIVYKVLEHLGLRDEKIYEFNIYL